jgi:hypothetical protein
MGKVANLADELNKARRGDQSLTFLYAQCLKCGWVGIIGLITGERMANQTCESCGKKGLKKVTPN